MGVAPQVAKAVEEAAAGDGAEDGGRAAMGHRMAADSKAADRAPIAVRKELPSPPEKARKAMAARA